MNNLEYKIVDVDLWEADAILEVEGARAYFQFDPQVGPSLEEAVKFLVKEACYLSNKRSYQYEYK